jgi:hypothetical protein
MLCIRSIARKRGAPVLLCPLLLSALWVIPARADTPKALSPKIGPVEQYLMPDRAAEIALARSAAPALISDKADVLVLGAHGYETAVHGSNGFVCLVGKPWGMDFDHPEFWNPKIRTPVCLNAAAAGSFLPDYLKRTQWVLAGVSRDEMAARTRAAWASHEFGPPALGSMAYMMSKEQYIIPEQKNWYPHVMFFVPATDGSPWGANSLGSPIFAQTSNVEPVTTYFIVVPKWSDGTLGPYIPAAAGDSQGHAHN